MWCTAIRSKQQHLMLDQNEGFDPPIKQVLQNFLVNDAPGPTNAEAG